MARAKESRRTKKLAAQFVPEFARFAESVADDAIDLLIDLCEEEDLLVKMDF